MDRETGIGVALGAVIGAWFGRIWLQWAGEGLSGGHQVLTVLGWLVFAAFAAAAAAVAVRAVRTPLRGAAASGAPAQPGRPHPAWFGPVIAVEVALVAGGAHVIHERLESPWLQPAWVLLVVGAHFVPFAILLRVPLFYWLAAALCGTAVAAVAAASALPGADGLWYSVPGFGGAVSLWAFAGTALTMAVRGTWGRQG
ncbi:hypothetical protein [Nocardiopsis coralliicola]